MGDAVMTEVGQTRKTVLWSAHVALGAKMVPFAGWEMPVQYSGVIAEHVATRAAAGLFDVSHMGELWVTGPESLQLIDSLTCNKVSAIRDGRAQYNAIITPSGGIVDDIIVYRFGPERFLICVNASNAEKDFAWFKAHNRFNAKVENASADYGQIALQGPRALEILTAMKLPVPERTFSFLTSNFEGAELIIARTGYTGEDGVEIFCPTVKTESIWNLALKVGGGFGLLPCGLGARDSLRLEACLPLHGHELGEEISAIESGLSWIVKADKGEFTGRTALQAHLASCPRNLIGFALTDLGIARHGDAVFSASGERVGVVTSGTKTPTVNKALGLALVSSAHSALGGQLSFEVRGRKLAGEVVATPFYKRAS